MNDRFRMLPSYHYEDSTDGKLLKSVGKSLRDYKIEGNCVQNGTPTTENPIEVECIGDKTKNLFDEKYLIELGFTLDNGKYYISPTKSLKVWENKNGTTGSLNIRANIEGGASGVGLSIQTFYTDGTWKWNSGVTDSSKTVDYVQLSYAAKRDTWVSEFLITEDTTSDEYEPYGYKIPISVSTSENLFDESKAIYSSNGKNIDFYIPAGQYSISIKRDFESAVYIRKGQVDSGYIATISAAKTMTTFTLSEDSYFRISHFITGGNISEIMLVKGKYDESTMPSYKPYDEPITTNIYLDEPLRKVGDYADYIDSKNSKLVRNICERNLVDVIPSVATQYANGLCRIQNPIAPPRPNYSIAPLCNRLKGYAGTIMAYADDITFSETYKNYYAYFNASTFGLEAVTATTTNAEIKTAIYNYLLESPIYFYYVRETPEEIEIDLPKILAKKGDCIVSIGTTTQPSNSLYQYYKGGR